MQVGDRGGEALEESQQSSRLQQLLRRLLRLFLWREPRRSIWRALRFYLWREPRRPLRRHSIEVTSGDEGLTAEAVLGVEG
jgi:hypothetical protein